MPPHYVKTSSKAPAFKIQTWGHKDQYSLAKEAAGGVRNVGLKKV